MTHISCPKCGFAMMHSKNEESCECGRAVADEVLLCLRCPAKVVIDRRGVYTVTMRSST